MEGSTEELDQEESEAAALEREEREAKEEEAVAKAEEEQRQAAAKQLAMPTGGIAPTIARLQVTGGAVQIPPHLMPDKDEEMQVRVLGWVKTVKDTTETKGGIAVREAVLVVEELEIVLEDGTSGPLNANPDE